MTTGFSNSNEPSIKVMRYPNFHKIGSKYLNLTFFAEMSTKKPLKVCYKVSLSKNFQQQSCSAFNYLSNGIKINILAGDDPVPVKFGPKGTNLQQEGCAFHVPDVARCPVSDSRPSCCVLCF